MFAGAAAVIVPTKKGTNDGVALSAPTFSSSGRARLAQKRAFGLEDLYRTRNVSDVHVSPDGTSIVYVLTSSDLARARRTSRLWIMDADGKNARQLTEESASSPAFSPDGRTLSFVGSKDGSTTSIC